MKTEGWDTDLSVREIKEMCIRILNELRKVNERLQAVDEIVSVARTVPPPVNEIPETNADQEYDRVEARRRIDERIRRQRGEL